MKCKECSSRYKGYWASAPDAYACVDAEEPFEIVDENAECVKQLAERKENKDVE